MAYLELRDITFAYDTSENPVFDGFSLSLEKGVCLAVRGDNGAGKTTLFRILNGLSFPVKGEYVLDGVKITREYLKDNANAKRFHKRMGYLFQNPDIMLFNAKVYDEIAFGPRQMGIGEDKVRERTEDCMNLLEIRQLADKAPYHLSEGQKKRVALAAVLALNPEILVLDEPFAGLDTKNRKLFMKILGELKKAGKTLIIATHSEEITEAFADRVLDLHTSADETGR